MNMKKGNQASEIRCQRETIKSYQLSVSGQQSAIGVQLFTPYKNPVNPLKKYFLCVIILVLFFFLLFPLSLHAEEKLNSDNSSRILIQGEFNGFKFATLSSCRGEWDEAWCLDAIPRPWSSEEINLITKALNDIENHHKLSHFLNAVKQSKYNKLYRYNIAPHNPSQAASASSSVEVKSIDFYNNLFNHWMRKVDSDEYYEEIIKGTLIHEMTHVIDSLNMESQARKYSHAPQFTKLSEWDFNSIENRWQYGNVTPFIIQNTFSYFTNLVSQQQYQLYKKESDKWNKTYKAVSLYSAISRKESLAEMTKAIVLNKEQTKKILNLRLIDWIEQKVLLIEDTDG